MFCRGEKQDNEIICKNIKRFFREANFLLPSTESYSVLNHSHANFLPLMTSIDSYASK